MTTKEKILKYFWVTQYPNLSARSIARRIERDIEPTKQALDELYKEGLLARRAEFYKPYKYSLYKVSRRTTIITLYRQLDSMQDKLETLITAI